MGRKPETTQALSGAERQARYRARQAEAPTARVREAVPSRRPLPRPRRWHAAVQTLLSLRAEYAAWYEAIPDATREGATGEALLALIDLDLDELAAIQPPRGFGRDEAGPREPIPPPTAARVGRPVGERETQPHDTLPARPFCPGACPGTDQERSGQITSYINRTG